MQYVNVLRKNKWKDVEFDKCTEDEQDHYLRKILREEDEGYRSLFAKDKSLEQQVASLRKLVSTLAIKLYRKNQLTDDEMQELLNEAGGSW